MAKPKYRMRQFIDIVAEAVSDEVDREYAADRLYHALAKYAAQHPSCDFEMEDRDDGRQFYAFEVARFDIEDMFGLDHVVVAVTKRQPGTHGISGAYTRTLNGKLTGKNLIVMYSANDEGLEKAKSSIGTVAFMDTFTHEVIHALDDVRTRGKVSASKGVDASDSASYYNDHWEFNAYYHDVARKFMDIITEYRKTGDIEDAKGYAELVDFTGNFTQDLKKLLDGDLGVKRFLKALLAPRRKALLKRLYKMHSEVVKLLASDPATASA